jgi:AbrB family looped-hinge helix DNA binding protein
MPTSTLTSKGQITLPKRVRERLGLRPGDRVDFEIEDGGGVRLRASGVDVHSLRGMLHRPGRKAVTLDRIREAIRRGAAGS